ncbi:AAA family ATPase [Gloeothece verrucosa]|uniref:AAA family ATPase n=1 Tax=Gloeothece verrucosa TaxID=2546359 RepID=UPI00017E1D74|nr:AAA family ATPase [Gloeothece verrucosa]
MINLIDVKNGILLIDEIENGIHYLNQREFWLHLFKLAKALDVQIFATTHSLEMIKAFADVGLKEYPEEAAYIELARHPKTHQIIGIKRDMETLDYALEHEKGVGLRGE